MTQPLGDFIEAALAGDIQGGRLFAHKGRVYTAAFRCCITGNSVGVDKHPVPAAIVYPTRVCTGVNVTVDIGNAYSPTGTGLHSYEIWWGDGSDDSGLWGGPTSFTHSYGSTGTYDAHARVLDSDGYYGFEYFQIEVVDCTSVPDDTLLVGLDQGVYKSEDGGVSWEASLSASPLCLAVKIDPFTHTRKTTEAVAACYTGGLFKTYNGGLSWHELNYPYDAYAVAYDKVVRNKFYVLGEDGSGQVQVSRTIDGGVTWSHYSVGRDTLKTTSHGALVSTFSGEYIFYTSTSGGAATIHRIDEDLTNNTQVMSWSGTTQMCMEVAQDDWLYLAPEYDGTYRGLAASDDYGDTWQSLGTTDWSAHVHTQDVSVDRFNPHVLVAVQYESAGSFSVWTSDDRGDTWREINAASDINFVLQRPFDDPETIYIGNFVTATDTLVASVWKGHNAFARDTGLPSSKVYDIAVL